MDYTIIITTIPPILTAVFAYLIARKRNDISERINKAKIDSEIHNSALSIVQDIWKDHKLELKREIEDLRVDNDTIRKKMAAAEEEIVKLRGLLKSNDDLINTLTKEISSLKNTIQEYEREISRLKQGI